METKKLGYLAYGGDWGNDFQVKKELEKLASQIELGTPLKGFISKKK